MPSDNPTDLRVISASLERHGCENSAKICSESAAEIERLHRDYSLLEELSPPDVSRAEFVQWCYDAWHNQRKRTLEIVRLRLVLAGMADCNPHQELGVGRSTGDSVLDYAAYRHAAEKALEMNE